MDVRKSNRASIIADNNNDNKPSVSVHDNNRYELCKVHELCNGQMKEFEIKTSLVNASILLIRQNNKFYAYSNKCCHYKVPLARGLN